MKKSKRILILSMFFASMGLIGSLHGAWKSTRPVKACPVSAPVEWRNVIAADESTNDSLIENGRYFRISDGYQQMVSVTVITTNKRKK